MPERAKEFHSLYDRWGSFLLLLASVPVIGSVMTVLGGVSDVALPLFIVLVVISNLVRNWLVVFVSGGIIQIFQ
jgi:membrane protein YqaA with SNARE-associated domain